MILPALCLLVLPTALQERRPVVPPEAQTRTPVVAPLRLELHDAAHLIGLRPLHQALDALDARTTQATAADAVLAFETLEQRRSRFEVQRDDLLDALRTGMQPPAGADTRIEGLPDGRVAVLAEPEQQEWVRTYLATRQPFDGLIDLTTVLWSLPAGPDNDALVARDRECLGPAQAAELIAQLEGLGGERITAPRVLAFGSSPVELVAGERLSFVADWEFLELADREGSVPVPVVESEVDGFEMRATGRPLADGRVELEVDLAYRNLRRPIPTLETTFGGRTAPVVIQLPEWSGARIEGRMQLAAHETLLLAARDPSNGDVVLALLRARTIEELPR